MERLLEKKRPYRLYKKDGTLLGYFPNPEYIQRVANVLCHLELEAYYDDGKTREIFELISTTSAA